LEVRLADQYVADAACLMSFQHRYQAAYAFACGKKMRTTWWQRGAMVTDGDLWAEWGLVFEVKVSRADFLGTFGANGKAEHRNRHEPILSAHWCVAPRGLVQPCELPDLWGLLVASGAGLSEVRKPHIYDVPQARLESIAYELLWTGYWQCNPAERPIEE